LGSQGQTLLISGEPGIGKSRLAHELITQAHVSGGQALLGASYAEGGAPYAPFKQIIRDVLRSGWYRGLEDGLELPGSVLADLIALAPELTSRYPDVPANPPLDPRAEQRRLFEHLGIFFSVLCDRTPLLLVLEDAHWADGGSLFLLRYLARHTRGQRVMLVATYREVELDVARPLHEVLLDLERERLATGLKLLRLDRNATRDMLAVLFGEGITAEFSDGIYRVTEGNPFFIEEVCKALVESGEVYFHDGHWDRPSIEELGIPQSVRVAIQSRLRVLSSDTQETLRIAAILGRVFEFDTLVVACAPDSDEAALGVRRGRTGWAADEDTLIDALEEAERAQLIEEVSREGGGSFAFVHGLIPSTLVESTRTLRRRRLHSRAATAIEACCPDDFEALAHHWGWAEEAQKASTYMFKAGQRAAGQYANQEALEYFEQALERVEEDEEYDRILKERAKILLDQYRGNEAVRDYEHLLQSARERGDRKAELHVLLGLAQASYISALDAEETHAAARSRELYRTAYALARELADKESMVRALVPTTWFGDFWPEYESDAAANVKEALELSREIGDEDLVADCVLAAFRGGAADWVEQGEELLIQLESRRDLVRLNQTCFQLMWSHLARGSLERCIECCESGLHVAREIAVSPVQYSTIKALAYIHLGEFGQAWNALQKEVADEAHRFGSAFKDFGTGIYLSQLSAHRKASELLKATVARLDRLGRAALKQWAKIELARAMIRSEPGEPAALMKITEDLANLSATVILAGMGEPSGVLAEIRLCQGRWNEALQAADAACAQTRQSGGSLHHTAAVQTRLRALLQLRRPEEVLSLAQEQIQQAEVNGHRSMLWQLRSALARALEMLGDAEAATQEYRAAAETIRELAQTIPDAELKHGFLADPMVSSIIAASDRTPD
jgi:tetratricopeptide (TPR) repeat protein